MNFGHCHLVITCKYYADHFGHSACWEALPSPLQSHTDWTSQTSPGRFRLIFALHTSHKAENWNLFLASEKNWLRIFGYPFEMERIDANQNHQGSTDATKQSQAANRSTCQWIRRNGRMITYVVTVLAGNVEVTATLAIWCCQPLFFSVFKLIFIYFPESWSMHIRCTTVWFYILNHVVSQLAHEQNSSNPHAVQSAPMLQVAAQTAVARSNGNRWLYTVSWGEKRGEKMSKRLETHGFLPSNIGLSG